MRRLLVGVLVVTLVGCGESDHYSHDDVVTALTDNGVQVQDAGSAPGDPFSVDARKLAANGHELRVYEYADTSSRERDSSTILADGWSVNGTQVEWIGAPHFWIRGRVIVLYLGSDAEAIAMITAAMGTPSF
ncbi:MAG: hypothetical protein V1757_02320 [Actinomycetota bacterium]